MSAEQMVLARSIALERHRLQIKGKHPTIVRLSPAPWDLYRRIWRGMPTKAAAGLLAERDESIDRFIIICQEDDPAMSPARR